MFCHHLDASLAAPVTDEFRQIFVECQLEFGLATVEFDHPLMRYHISESRVERRFGYTKAHCLFPEIGKPGGEICVGRAYRRRDRNCHGKEQTCKAADEE